METVKKYNNRKLYFNGKYINLKDLVTMVREGKQVQVLENGTNKDLTQETLRQALLLLPLKADDIIRIIRR